MAGHSVSALDAVVSWNVAQSVTLMTRLVGPVVVTERPVSAVGNTVMPVWGAVTMAEPSSPHGRFHGGLPRLDRTTLPRQLKNQPVVAESASSSGLETWPTVVGSVVVSSPAVASER